jgi:hypothetical protein
MKNQIIKDTLVWGFVLWLIGYALGMVLFSVVPPSMIGWVIMPIGTVITLWILFKKIKASSFQYYLLLSAAWTLMAVVLDYFFLVKALNPADGYYKLDVYLYYALTFVFPLAVYFLKRKKSN